MLKTIAKPESDAKAKEQAERTVTALVKAKPQSLVPLNHLGYSASVVPSNMQDGEDYRISSWMWHRLICSGERFSLSPERGTVEITTSQGPGSLMKL